MTLERLRQPRGSEAQLMPLVEEIGFSWGYYKKNIDDVTNALVEEGRVVQLDTIGNFKRDMRELIEKRISLPDSELIIPAESPIIFSDEEESRMSKLPLAKVPRYHNLTEGHKTIPLIVLVNRMMNNVRFGNNFVGYDWQSELWADRKINFVHFVDCIRGKVLSEDQSLDVRVRDYLLRGDGFRKGIRKGGNVLVENIPSIEGRDDQYKITLTGVPIFYRKSAMRFGLTKEQARLTFCLSSNHFCSKSIPYELVYSRQFIDSKSGRVTPEVLLDYHVIHAFFEVQEFVDQERKEGIVANVFYKPKIDEINFFWALYEKTMVEYKEGESHVMRFPLTLRNIERMLWNYRGYKNKK